MSNYAALIAPISICGCLTNTGTPNVNGKVWAFLPGTTTPANLYADPAAQSVVTQPVTLDAGGRVPYATYPNGLYTTQPIRLLIQDVNGVNVSDTTFQSGVGDVGNNNASPSLTTAPFSGTTLDQILAAIKASTGGQDAQYLESPGATARPIQSVIRGIQVSVKDFGAVGNGTADDTVPVQEAITEVIRLGGGRVYFDPGNYKCRPLNVTSATGVVLVGAGRGATTLTLSGAGDAIDMVSTTSCAVFGMTVTGNIAWSGTSTLATMDGVSVLGGTGSSMNSMTFATLRDCRFNGTSQGLTLTDSTAVEIFGGIIAPVTPGSGNGLKITGGTNQVTLVGVGFSGAQSGVLFDASSSGHGFSIIGCPSLSSCTTPIDMSAISADPIVYQAGNLTDSFLYSAAVGNTLSIKLSNGYAPVLKAASGGAGTMTVAAPAPTPAASVGPAPILEIQFINAAGGAVTWSMNAAFVLAGAVAIPTTDGHTINVVFRWDYLTSKWREVSRSDTTT